MQSKLKVLVFGNMGFGHMIPLMPVIKQLITNGHEIVFIIGSEVQDLVQDLKAEIHAYPIKMSEMFASIILEIQQTGRVQGLENIEQTFESMFLYTNNIMDWIYQTFGNRKFDLVIADSFSLMGHVFTSKYRIPMIVSVSQILVTSLEKQFETSDKACQLIRQFNEKHGTNLNSIGCMVYQDQNIDARFINYNIPQFSLEPPTTKQPPTWFHMDHNMIQGKLEPKPLVKGSTIYISIGTLFTQNDEFFKMILQYFNQNGDYKGVISAGASQQSFDLLNSFEKSANVEVRLWVDQREILKESSVFISHCGFNSLKEGISYGNVIIAYPQCGDQPYNSNLVEKVGLGVYPRDLSQEKLEQALKEIADNYDSYFKRINDLRSSFLVDTINCVSLGNEIEQYVDQAQKK